MGEPLALYENGEYLANNPDWHAADSPFKAQWIADILARNHVDPKHIVDVGTGSGEVLVQLAHFFPHARLEGFEISPQAYAIAVSKESARMTIHQGDYLACDWPQPDVVMAIDVFEHVEDYMAFLKAIKPRAPLKVFHIPLDLSVQGILRGRPIIRAREKIGHLHYFFKDTALAVLADCGYEIVDWNYTHGAETLPNRALRTRSISLLRRAMRTVNEDLSVRLLGGASMMVLAR